MRVCLFRPFRFFAPGHTGLWFSFHRDTRLPENLPEGIYFSKK
jgi:hypothetical protein